MDKYYVYQYIDDETTLYVGITGNMIERHKAHKKDGWYHKDVKCLYAQVPNKSDQYLLEMYLINKKNAIYNVTSNYGIQPTFKIKEPRFYEFRESDFINENRQIETKRKSVFEKLLEKRESDISQEEDKKLNRRYNPLPKKKRDRVERKLTYEEVQAILDHVRGHKTKHVIISFLLFTGLRLSELCELNWGDVQIGLEGHLYLRVIGNGDKERKIGLRKDLYGLLLEHRSFFRLSLVLGINPEEPLIVNEQIHRLNARVVRYLVERVVRGAGVKKFKENGFREQKVSPHWFRHSAATFALDVGANIHEVQRVLGHADITTTQVYLHEGKDDR